MRYDYDRYGDGMHPSLFIHAYTNEYLRGKIGSNRSTGVENPPIRAEAEAHARELGRRMAEQEAKRKEKALLERAEKGKSQTSGEIQTVRESINRKAYSEDTIDNNIKELAQMDSVCNIPKERLQRTGKRPRDIFEDYFNAWNNNIYTDEFGDVELPKSSAKSEIRHGLTAEKIASIEAIPNVLQMGKVIFRGNKSADVERLVVAAPIKIGNVDYYMGVMLQRDSQNQRLYLHNVEIQEETAMSSPAWSHTNRADGENDNLFMTSILQNALVVKYHLNKKTERSGDFKNSDRPTIHFDASIDQAALSERKQATVEAAEARELGRRMAVQEAKRKEKALLERAEAGKTQTGGDADVRYSIRRTADGEEIVVIDTDQDIFEGVERSEYGRVVGRYFSKHYQGRELSGVFFNKDSKDEYTYSDYTKGVFKVKDGIYEAKMKAGTELENMIRTGSFLRHENAKHPSNLKKNGLDIYRVHFEIDSERFNAEMLIAIGINERRTFFDIQKIKKESRPAVVFPPRGELTAPISASSEDSIPQKEGVVNSKSENKNRESKRKQYDHIHFPSKYARKHLSERKQATAEAAEVLANALGTEIYFYQSYERDGKRYYKENGKERIAPNGFIDANKHIHIDLNSGMDGRGIGIFTLAHETAHFIHDYDPVAFHDMAAEVVRRIEGTGVDMHRKVLDKLSDLDKRGVLAGMSFEEMYDYAHEEIIADALEPMLADGRTLSEVVDANPSLFRKIIDHIKAIIQKIKNAFAGMKPDSEAGQVVQAMMDSMEDVREMFSSAILTAGERRRAVGSGANTSTTYTIRFSDGDSMDRGESKQIIRIIHENEKSIPTQLSFDVRYSNEVENYQKKSEYVSSIFDEQGNEAFHPVIGRVELVKSGAKSTITHGYGHEKLSAIRAIKPAIENGNIISYVQNYGGKNVDRYVIAAKGLINGHEAYIGVVVKSYPTQKTDNKFYLHEVEIIETDSPVMTAPQLSVDTVRESASTDSIPQSEANVNTMGQKNSDRPFDDAVERMYAREAGEEADAAKETPLAPRPKDEYTTRALLRELLSTKITRKDDRAFMERYGEKLAELDHWKAEIERMERPLNGHRARRAELQRKKTKKLDNVELVLSARITKSSPSNGQASGSYKDCGFFTALARLLWLPNGLLHRFPGMTTLPCQMLARAACGNRNRRRSHPFL